MEPRAYQAFTQQLLGRLSAEPGVLGVVALGSMSGIPPAPDEFSDHDFFVVVDAGLQERYRNDLAWLPEPGNLVHSFRETPHGLKALWSDGHLAEFAVFSLDELALARVNRYAVLLDRADVAARMERVRAATAVHGRRSIPDERWSLGMFLGALVVGSGRWARGERLAGHQLVRCAAVGHLLALLRGGLSPEREGLLDDLDPLRRVELAIPDDAREIAEALPLPPPAGARALLGLLLRRRPELVSAAILAAVERALGTAERASRR